MNVVSLMDELEGHELVLAKLTLEEGPLHNTLQLQYILPVHSNEKCIFHSRSITFHKHYQCLNYHLYCKNDRNTEIINFYNPLF